LENLMQEHDVIKQDIELLKDNHSVFSEIDKWEKQSITKIQVAAEQTRADLRAIFEQSNEQFSRTCQAIATKLRSAREAENFSEIDLNRWTEQLNELKSQTKSLSMIHTVEDNTSGIHFIKVEQDNTINSHKKSKESLSSKISLSSRIEEKFAEGNGLATIDDEGLRVRHIDTDFKFVYFRGQRLYLDGRHTMRFKVEQSTNSCNIFIGICSSNIGVGQIIYYLTIVAGWFNNMDVWQHGRCVKNTKLQGSKNAEIKTNDTFQFILDCDNKQIELLHERTNKKYTMVVDLVQAPLPWKILLALGRKNDCVKILPNN